MVLASVHYNINAISIAGNYFLSAQLWSWTFTPNSLSCHLCFGHLSPSWETARANGTDELDCDVLSLPYQSQQHQSKNASVISRHLIKWAHLICVLGHGGTGDRHISSPNTASSDPNSGSLFAFPVSSALIHNHCNVKTSFHMLHLLTVINFSLSPHTHIRSFYLTSKSWKKVHSHQEYRSAITGCLTSEQRIFNWFICWTTASLCAPCTSPGTFCPCSGLFLLPSPSPAPEKCFY